MKVYGYALNLAPDELTGERSQSRKVGWVLPWGDGGSVASRKSWANHSHYLMDAPPPITISFKNEDAQFLTGPILEIITRPSIVRCCCGH